MLKPYYFPNFSGFSLLEVLIATFILTFGLLGVMEIYLHSFKRIEDSYWHTLAISQLGAIEEQRQIFGGDCSSWSKDCERLLPHGKCSCSNGYVKVCWKNKQDERCLEL